MINLALLREQSAHIRALITKKDPAFPIDKLIELDATVRAHTATVEQLRHEKNLLAQQAKQGVTEAIREQSKMIGAQLKQVELELATQERTFHDLYLRCPNVIEDSVPAGDKRANTVVKEWHTDQRITQERPHHVAVGDQLKWFAWDAAAQTTGSNFAWYQNEAVQLVYALANFMLNNNMRFGYQPMLPPYVVTEKSLECASNFPRFKDQVYAITEDGLYLTPTAEVNLTNLYRDHIFEAHELPVRMTAWTSCFRREAGTYGATERGLIRIHQFEKVELYTICPPENAPAEQERMLACAEAILQALDLPYRISLLAAQDCSFASAKTYDIEVWMPGQKSYYEVSSVSNCTDFQARRAAIRYRPTAGGKPSLVYTLNGSSLALPRIMVALLETYRQPDGSLVIPEALRSVTISLPERITPRI